MSNEVISRSEAIRQGKKRYFTGRPCPQGHVTERDVRRGHCCECRRNNMREAKKSEAAKAWNRQWAKEYARQMDPQMKKARNAAYHAIRKGRLTREPCQVCGSSHRIEAHHEDYLKPLDVMWLCKKHHYERHRELESQHGKRY